MKNKKGKLISIDKSSLEKHVSDHEMLKEKIVDKQVAVLLGELKTAQFELEIQNNELSISAQLLEIERSKFESFFNLAPVGYFVLDHLGVVEEANQVGVKLLEIEKAKLISQPFQRFIDPDDWEIFYGFLHRMQPKGIKQTVAIKLKNAKTHEIYTSMEGIALEHNFSGKWQYYVTIIDITESRLAEQELKEAAQRLELTLGASGIGTWTIDLSNKTAFLDHFSLALLEVNEWEFDGSLQGFLNIIHPEDQHFLSQAILSSHDQAKKIDIELRVITKEKAIKNIAIKGHQVKRNYSKSHFAGIIIDITKRKQLLAAEKELENEKQKLILAATFSAQEKERNRISSVLHDSIGQLLYGIRLNLQHIQLGNQLKNEFNNVHELLAQAIKETRELSYELTPSILRDFGLMAGIKEMAERLSTKYFHIVVKVKEDVDLLPSDLQFSVFRIVQELLNNCIKYARANKAEIKTQLANGQINLVITDNGKGFDQEVESAMTKGSGLRGIKNRVFLLNGNFDIDSSEKGTRITIHFEHK